MEDYLQHYGVKGMKWGVRKSKRYLDNNESLTFAGKKQLRKLNRLDYKDNRDRDNYDLAEYNVERFGSKKDPVSKLITKMNETYMSDADKVIERNKVEIDRLIADLKSQKVDLALSYDPYTGTMRYKQSDAQWIRAQESKWNRKR